MFNIIYTSCVFFLSTGIEKHSVYVFKHTLLISTIAFILSCSGLYLIRDIVSLYCLYSFMMTELVIFLDTFAILYSTHKNQAMLLCNRGSVVIQKAQTQPPSLNFGGHTEMS